MATSDVELPGGRSCGVWDGGDRGGRPVMFFPGTPSSRLQAAHGDDAARAAGVRLVAFNRPGYGTSPPARPSLAAVGRDATEVADLLGLGRFAVLGVSGGGPFAAATAALAGERVTSLAVLAGTGPWRLLGSAEDGAEVGAGDGAELRERELLALADGGQVQAAVEGFEAVFEELFGALLALEDTAMVDAFLSQVPPTENSSEPAYRARWAADLREALTSYTGGAIDNVAWGGRWDVDLSDVRQPTALWYGGADDLVPVHHGEWYAQQIPHATFTVRPGEGHGLTSLTHWDETFAALRT